ncbi:MAG: transposase [Chloroflexota bacterium]|nr:transposase [Chloroflexota bacterium]
MHEPTPLPQRKSPRLQGYDYRSNGAYFVTICSAQREWIFGEIVDDHMSLSAIGIIATRMWDAIPDHFPHVELDAFVVMPNHVHGVLVFASEPVGTRHPVERTRHASSLQNHPTTVGTTHASSALGNSSSGSAQSRDSSLQERAKGAPSGSLGAVIGSYKSAVTRVVNQELGLHAPLIWQERYHDHIIRDEKSLHIIREYVVNNPMRWAEDTFFSSKP